MSDGWRHLRFLLLLSPKYLFVVPGLAFLVVGLLGTISLFGVSGGTHLILTKALSAAAVIVGVQLLVLGCAATARVANLTLNESNKFCDWVTNGTAAKQGFASGTALVGSGIGLLVYGYLAGWGAGNGAPTSLLILALLLSTLGGILWFDAFFLSLFEARTNPPRSFHMLTEDQDHFVERRQQGRRQSDVELPAAKF